MSLRDVPVLFWSRDHWEYPTVLITSYIEALWSRGQYNIKFSWIVLHDELLLYLPINLEQRKPRIGKEVAPAWETLAAEQ